MAVAIAKRVRPLLRRGAALLPPRWTRAAVDRLAAVRARRFCPVLTYHAVESVRGTNPLLGAKLHNVTPDALARQLELLSAHFQVLPIDELAERARAGRSLSGLAAVTFDDGYRSVIDHGVPVLEALEVPATLFVTTAVLRGRVMWRDKIRFALDQGLGDALCMFAATRVPALAGLTAERLYTDTKDPTRVSSRAVDELLDEFFSARGLDLSAYAASAYCDPAALGRAGRWLTIGSHTRDHYALASLPPKEQLDQVKAARDELQSWDVVRSDVLAIPFGGPHMYDVHSLHAIRDAGHLAYVSCRAGQVTDARADVPSAARLPEITGLWRYMPRENNPWFLFAN